MPDLTSIAPVIAAVGPLIIGLLAAGVFKSLTPTGRLERRIRSLSGLLGPADQPSTAGVRAVIDHLTALYVSRCLVKSYPGRFSFVLMTAAAGGLMASISLPTGSGPGTTVGFGYLILGGSAATYLGVRTNAMRERTYRALRAGRPSALHALDIDMSVPRNVRRARSVRVASEKRSTPPPLAKRGRAGRIL